MAHDLILSATEAFTGGDAEACTGYLGRALGDPALTPRQRALLLNLLAMAHATLGERGLVRERLGEAADIERREGSKHGAEHTTHAAMLLNHLRGDLSRARDYYKSTFRTCYQSRNAVGMGLCQRSLGAMALLYGRHRQAIKSLRQGRERFGDAAPQAELDCLDEWIALIEGLETPDANG